MFDFETLQPETVKLETTHIDQAMQLSQQMLHQGQKWQTYINALALFGFQQWLWHRAPDIYVNLAFCSVFHPPQANLIDGVCNLFAGKFKVCLIAVNSLNEPEITIPRAAIDLPEFIPHFYVMVEVGEECQQATIQSFLRYDQLRSHLCETGSLEVNSDWTYTLPLTWFESDLDRLLLYLECLEPATISLPTATPQPSYVVAKMQAELTALLPQIQSAHQFLWEVISWEKVAIVCKNPELLTWLYQQLSPVPAAQLVPPVMNVGLWLRNQTDELTQQLAWVLLPPIVSAMRSPLRCKSALAGESPMQELKVIIKEVEVCTGTKTPTQARGAYHNFQLAENQLRLYAIIWSLLPVSDIPEWTLLIILGAQPEHKLPDGIKLQVHDQKQVLVERTKSTGDIYLYARVAGQWDETFLVTIALATGVILTLPPFAFHLS